MVHRVQILGPFLKMRNNQSNSRMITALNRKPTCICKLENESGWSTRQGLQLTAGQMHIKSLREARMSRAIVQRPSDRGSCSTCCTGMCNVTIIIFIESCDVGSFRMVQGFEVGAPDFPSFDGCGLGMTLGQIMLYQDICPCSSDSLFLTLAAISTERWYCVAITVTKLHCCVCCRCCDI